MTRTARDAASVARRLLGDRHAAPHAGDAPSDGEAHDADDEIRPADGADPPTDQAGNSG